MDTQIRYKSDMLKISVVIPVYKVESYLHQCVDSVLSQTYENIEVILVDDGSPDSCPEICDQYANADTRVKVIHQKNGGLSAARNAGVQCASGNYLAFLDSDDFWNDRTALERLVCRLQITNADVLNYSYVKCDESGGEITKQFDNEAAMPTGLKNIQEQLAYAKRAEHYGSFTWTTESQVRALKYAKEKRTHWKLRQKIRSEKVRSFFETHFPKPIVQLYTFVVYDFIDYGMIYWIKLSSSNT